MHLNHYTTGTYSPGASFCKQLLWYFIGDPLVRNRLIPTSSFKVIILRIFGAKIGKNVRIKPGFRVKYPWQLWVGDYVWLGEDAWIDNLVPVVIKNHVCLSQRVYLCTGNHDWTHPNFKLVLGEIYIESGSWICAKAVIGPGVTVGEGAVLGLGSVAGKSLEPMTIYTGNPAQPLKKRVIQEISIPHP